MSPPTPPDPALIAARLRDNRARVLAGEDIPDEEYRDLMEAIRQTRIAATQSELRRPRAPKSASTPISAADLEPI